MEDNMSYKNIRKYAISTSELSMFSSNLISSLYRDIDEFSQFDIDETDINELINLTKTYQNFPPDTYFHADIRVYANQKKIIKKQLIESSKKISRRAAVKYGINSPLYKSFGVSNIDNFLDNELLASALFIATIAENNLDLLSDQGLTQSIIDDYRELTNEYQSKLFEISSAIETRIIKTQERIELANLLYEKVNKFCLYGKMIWYNRNKAKYDSYIIYSKPSKANLKAPKDLFYDSKDRKFKWTPVSKSSNYILEYSTNGTDYHTYWEGNENYANYHYNLSSKALFRIKSGMKKKFGNPSSAIEVDFSIK